MAGLCISRKAGQTVVIESPGFALVVCVDKIERGKTVLRFVGPRAVRVWRGELFGCIRGFDEYDRLVEVESKNEVDGWGFLDDEDCEAASGGVELKEGTDAAETSTC